MSKSGLCKLCLNHKELKNSHGLGDSIFKKIYRKNSGKAICLTSDDDDIHYSSDSWAEYQLCNECESLLNINYETYSLSVLRGKKVSINKTSLGIKFSNLDQHKFILYFLSILWRAANSNHESYKNVVILDSDNEFLRKAILNNLKIPSSKFTIKINRVIDLSESRGFNPSNLKEFILSPFCRIYGANKVNNISLCFMFEGFFIEIFIPPLKLKERNKVGILHKNKKVLFVPYLDIFKIDEIVELMVNNYGKHQAGMSKIKANKKRYQ